MNARKPAAVQPPCPVCDAIALADAQETDDLTIAVVFAFGLHLGNAFADLGFIRSIMCERHRTAHTLASLTAIAALERAAR